MDEDTLFWLALVTTVVGILTLIPLVSLISEETNEVESGFVINGTVLSTTTKTGAEIIINGVLKLHSSKPAYLLPGMRIQAHGDFQRRDGKTLFVADDIAWE